MATGRRKVTVIGAGTVGATAAQRLAERDYADVVLVDVVDGLAEGKALDLNETGPVVGYEATVTGSTNDYSLTAGSDVIVVTSGLARKPGMSRDDLLLKNQEIVGSVVRAAAEQSPEAIFVIVSNPLDAMCHVALSASGFPSERVVGMAGVLDSARFRTFIAWELGVSVRDVTGFVLGGHGDTMVPVASNTTVSGIPVTELIPEDRLEQIIQRARDGGAEVVKLLKTGSAYYAPSAAAVEMVDSIILDQKRVLPAAAYLTGEYGFDGIYLGVPVTLGAKGVEKIHEISLTDTEKAQLASSADAVRELVDVMATKA
ncbi:MAG: malate dehydrogenase, NAD-dependent [Thermoleophilia bacterium]|nr:malate dehydrogenase, NAD-dependent [Thermoleophilia bacterium]